MSLTGSTPLAVPDVPSEVDVALGPLYDANGVVVTADSVATLDSVTPTDATLAGQGAISGLTGQVETTGAAGTFTIKVAATTVNGVAVTGESEPITVSQPGPPVTVGVNVSLGAPVTPPA